MHSITSIHVKKKILNIRWRDPYQCQKKSQKVGCFCWKINQSPQTKQLWMSTRTTTTTTTTPKNSAHENYDCHAHFKILSFDQVIAKSLSHKNFFVESLSFCNKRSCFTYIKKFQKNYDHT